MTGPMHGVRIVAPPMQFDGALTAPRGPAPEIGQHTEEVFVDAGFEWDEITAASRCGRPGTSGRPRMKGPRQP
ncbi:MAG: hypothetical protein ABW328_19960 [Ilumatobacteraceae bacterium]